MFKKVSKYFVAAVNIAVALAIIFVSAPEIQAANSNNNILHNKIIILDAGHGTVGSPGYGNYNEAVAMLKLANKIKGNLESYGATVYMTRLNEHDVHLAVRTAMINIWALEELKKAYPNESREVDRLIKIMQDIIGDYEKHAPVYMNFPFDDTYKRKIHPDLQKIFEYQNNPVIRDRFLVISLHSNATPKPINTSLHGTMAFYASNNCQYNPVYYLNYSNERRSRNFAEKLLNNIAKIGIEKRRIESGAAFMIREHNVPAVLVENGFHTNDRDRAKLSDDAFLDKLAQVYADTISDYFSGYSQSAEEHADNYEIFDIPEIYNMKEDFNAYEEPNFTSNKIATFPAQTVSIRARKSDGWALISTSRGKLWIYIPKYQTLAEPELYNMTSPFTVHREPDFMSEIIMNFPAQIISIRAKTADGWALISTSRGRFWVYIGD